MILLAMPSLAILNILCSRVSLYKSKVWWQNNDISSLISVIWSIFLGISSIFLKKNHVYIGVLELA